MCGQSSSHCEGGIGKPAQEDPLVDIHVLRLAPSRYGWGGTSYLVYSSSSDPFSPMKSLDEEASKSIEYIHCRCSMCT